MSNIPVLDAGYVKYIDHMGSDLSVVNAARASFKKESKEWTSADERLLHFLARENHSTPLRHCVLSLELKAPMMVTRQLQRYAVASLHAEEQTGWSEASYRYVTLGMEFHNPTLWRMAAENKKQGSAGNAAPDVCVAQNLKLASHIQRSMALYESALSDGIAPEQARLFLPAYGLYITWRWTMSLQTALHVIRERTAPDCQWETRQYGLAIADTVHQLFPYTTEAWL